MGNEASASGTYSDKTKRDIDAAIASGPIMMFSASYCPYCRKAKDLLKPWKPFTIVEVDQIGNNAIMGKYSGGCDDATALYKNGKLQKMIDAAKNQTESP